VRITAIRPKIDRDGGIMLAVNVIARSVDDVNEFMENLEQTGAFSNINTASDKVNEDGQLESQIEAMYAPANAKAPAAAEQTPRATPAAPRAAGGAQRR
jgi:Tfp pilus assembly protein PilN